MIYGSTYIQRDLPETQIIFDVILLVQNVSYAIVVTNYFYFPLLSQAAISCPNYTVEGVIIFKIREVVWGRLDLASNSTGTESESYSS